MSLPSYSSPQDLSVTDFMDGTKFNYVLNFNKRATSPAAVVARDGSTYYSYLTSDGSTIASGSNASTVINTTLTTINTAGGGVVRIKRGTYEIPSSITLKSLVQLIGEGFYGGTKLEATAAMTGSVVTGFFSQNSPGIGIRVSNMEVDATNVPAPAEYSIGKKGIDGEHFVKSRFDNLYIHNTRATGLGIDSLEQCIIDHNWIETCGTANESQGSNGVGVGTGERLIESVIVHANYTKNIANSAYLCEELASLTTANRQYIFSDNISDSDFKAFSVSGCPNVSIDNNQIYNPTHGIRAIKFVTHFPLDCKITNNVIVGSEEAGIFIDTNCGEWEIQSNTVMDCDAEGIIIRGHNGVIANNRIHDNGTHGMFIGAASTGTALSHIQIQNNQVYNNGLDAVGANGIRIDATEAAISQIVCTGNHCYDNQGTKTQAYGIAVTGGSGTTDVLIANNDVNDNLTGGILLSPSGTVTELVVRDNPGYNPGGTAVVSPGASPYTYTAGYSPETIYLYSGTVSSITKGGIQIANASPAQIFMEANDSIVITYSVAPTMRKDRH